MNTKIAYCLVSDDSDYYYEQLLISLYSLRRHNPDAIVELVVDEDTNATFVNERTKVYDYVTKVILIDVPHEFSKKQRSRYIKTSLREHIQGDYLFIDTDTIIQSTLAEIDSISADICAVQEYNRLKYFTKNDNSMQVLASKVGLVDELENEPYFNSGVMYVKDSSRAHQFFESWHTSWKETLSKGLDTDQTSLCWANKKEGHVIEFLDDSWNCLLKQSEGLRDVKTAKIVHYACEHKGTRHISSLLCMFAALKSSREVTPIIVFFIENPAIFMINGKEEIFLRESKSIYNLHKYHHSFFAFILWQAELIMHMISMVGKLKRHG